MPMSDADLGLDVDDDEFEDVSGEIHKSLEAAKKKLRTDLLNATGLVPGDSAHTRIEKVWDSMDSIGATTSCRPWLLFKNQDATGCFETRPNPMNRSQAGNFRREQDWVCSNGGHCVYEEELFKKFQTNGEGLEKLLNKDVVLDQSAIDEWLEVEVKKAEVRILKEAKAKVEKERKQRAEEERKRKAAEEVERKRKEEEERKRKAAEEAERQRLELEAKKKKEEHDRLLKAQADAITAVVHYTLDTKTGVPSECTLDLKVTATRSKSETLAKVHCYAIIDTSGSMDHAMKSCRGAVKEMAKTLYNGGASFYLGKFATDYHDIITTKDNYEDVIEAQVRPNGGTNFVAACRDGLMNFLRNECENFDEDSEHIVTVMLLTDGAASNAECMPTDAWFDDADQVIEDLAERGVFVQCQFVGFDSPDAKFMNKFTGISLDPERATALYIEKENVASLVQTMVQTAKASLDEGTTVRLLVQPPAPEDLEEGANNPDQKMMPVGLVASGGEETGFVQTYYDINSGLQSRLTGLGFQSSVLRIPGNPNVVTNVTWKLNETLSYYQGFLLQFQTWFVLTRKWAQDFIATGSPPFKTVTDRFDRMEEKFNDVDTSLEMEERTILRAYFDHCRAICTKGHATARNKNQEGPRLLDALQPGKDASLVSDGKDQFAKDTFDRMIINDEKEWRVFKKTELDEQNGIGTKAPKKRAAGQDAAVIDLGSLELESAEVEYTYVESTSADYERDTDGMDEGLVVNLKGRVNDESIASTVVTSSCLAVVDCSSVMRDWDGAMKQIKGTLWNAVETASINREGMVHGHLSLYNRDLLATRTNEARKATSYDKIFTPYALKKTTITPSTKMDHMGNPIGTNYDLVDDGTFSGQKLIFLGLESNEPHFGEYPEPTKALERKGFIVESYTAKKGLPSPESLDTILQTANQLWIVSDHMEVISDAHIDVIEKNWKDGMGIYVFGENYPYYKDANRILARLVPGIQLDGNSPGNTTVGRISNEKMKRGEEPGINSEHVITTGINSFFEGSTISFVDPEEAVKQGFDLVFRDHGGEEVQPMAPDGGISGTKPKAVTIARKTQESEGPLIVDGGWTRLWTSLWKDGTDRYIMNCAAFLAVDFGREFEKTEHDEIDGESFTHEDGPGAYFSPEHGASTFSSAFDSALETATGDEATFDDPHETIGRYLERCEYMPFGAEHHVTVILATAGIDVMPDQKWYIKMRQLVRDAAQRRIYIQISVLGFGECDGLVVNALSGLTFDEELLEVEYGHIGGSVRVHVGQPLGRLLDRFVNACMYFPLTIKIAPDTLVDITAYATRADPLTITGWRRAIPAVATMSALRDDCTAASELCNKSFTESGNAEILSIPVVWSLRVSDREMSAAQTELLIAAIGGGADATSDMLAKFRENNHGYNHDDDDDDDVQNHVAEIEHLVLHHDLFWHRVHHWTDQHDTLVEIAIEKAQATLDSERPPKFEHDLDDLGDPNNMFGTTLSNQVKLIKQMSEDRETNALAQGEYKTKSFELMLAAATEASSEARLQMLASFKAIEAHAKSIHAYSLEIGWSEGWKTVEGDEGFDMMHMHGFIASHFSDHSKRVSYCASTWVETVGFGHATGAEVLMQVFKPSARNYEKQLRKEHKAYVIRAKRKQRDLLNSEEQALRGAGQLDADNYDDEGVSKGNPFTAFDDHDNDGDPDSAIKDLEGFGFEAEFGFAPAPQPQLWLRSKQKYRPEEVSEVHTLQLTVRAEKLRLEEFEREQAEAAKHRAEMQRREDEQREQEEEAARELQAEVDRKAAAEKAKKKVNKKGVLARWGRKEVVDEAPPPVKSNYMPAASVFAFGGRPLSFTGHNMSQPSSAPEPKPAAAEPATAKPKKKKHHIMTWRKKKKKPGHLGQHQHVTTVKQPVREADQDNEEFEEIAVGEQLDVLQDLGDGTLLVSIHGNKHAVVPAYVIDEPQAAWKSRFTKRSPAKPRKNSMEIGMDFDMFAAGLQKERDVEAKSHSEKKDVFENWGFGHKHGGEEEEEEA